MLQIPLASPLHHSSGYHWTWIFFYQKRIVQCISERKWKLFNIFFMTLLSQIEVNRTSETEEINNTIRIDKKTERDYGETINFFEIVQIAGKLFLFVCLLLFSLYREWNCETYHQRFGSNKLFSVWVQFQGQTRDADDGMRETDGFRFDEREDWICC